MCKMQEGDDSSYHINMVKAFVDKLVCLEVPMRNEDVILVLVENLPPLYKYLITTLKKMLLKELIVKYVTTHLIHRMS